MEHILKFLIALLLCLQAFTASAKASDGLLAGYEVARDAIVDVPSTEDPRAQLLQNEFSALLKAAGVTEPVKLVVTTSDLIGQAFPGRVVAVNIQVAQVSKAQRTFILAHELGHVLMEHFGAVLLLLDKHETSSQTFVVDQAFVRENITPMSHLSEFAADEFAGKCLLKMNLSISDAAKFFEAYESSPENASHPAMSERLKRLLALARQ